MKLRVPGAADTQVVEMLVSHRLVGGAACLLPQLLSDASVSPV